MSKITSIGEHLNDNYLISRSNALRSMLSEIEAGHVEDSGAMIIVYVDTGEDEEQWNTGYRMVQCMSSKGVAILETLKLMLFDGMGYLSHGED